MNNSTQDPKFIPDNNINTMLDIANQSKEVELELNENSHFFDSDADSHPSKELIKRYGKEYSDSIVEDFHNFDPKFIAEIGEDEEYETVLADVAEGGLEVVAFYKSFRFINSNPAKGKWGIFLIKPNIISLIREVAHETRHPLAAAYEAITRLVYIHELYHYKVDATCLQRESISLNPTYIPYRNYINGISMSNWWEEAIANYYGLNAILKSSSKYHCPLPLQHFLFDFVSRSPGAYSLGTNKAGQSQYRDFLSDQLNMATCPAITRTSGGFQRPSSLALDTTKIGLKLDRPNDKTLSYCLSLNKCPTFWITPPLSIGHHPKYLQNITLSELEKLFISKYLNGTEVVRTDHKFYKIDNGESIKMPNYHSKNVKTGEMKNILIKSGLTTGQFFQERQRTKVWRQGVPRSPTLSPRIASEA